MHKNHLDMTPYENMMQIAYYMAAFMAVMVGLVYWNYFKYYYKKEK